MNTSARKINHFSVDFFLVKTLLELRQSWTKLLGTPPLPLTMLTTVILFTAYSRSLSLSLPNFERGRGGFMLAEELRLKNIMTGCPNSFVQDCLRISRSLELLAAHSRKCHFVLFFNGLRWAKKLFLCMIFVFCLRGI